MDCLQWISAAAVLLLSACASGSGFYNKAPPGQFAWQHVEECRYWGKWDTGLDRDCIKRRPLCVNDTGHAVKRAHCAAEYSWHFASLRCPMLTEAVSLEPCTEDTTPRCLDSSGREYEPEACQPSRTIQ